MHTILKAEDEMISVEETQRNKLSGEFLMSEFIMSRT